MPSVYEDRDEIRQLMYRYGHTWDNQDFRGWTNVFAEDGVYWEGGGPVFKGREELYSYAQDTSPRFSGRFHIVTNQLIDVEGDTARAHSYFVIIEGLNPCLSGTYDDKIVRTGEGWLFAERIVTCLFPGGFPIAGNDMASWVFTEGNGGGWQHRSHWRGLQYSVAAIQHD